MSAISRCKVVATFSTILTIFKQYYIMGHVALLSIENEQQQNIFRVLFVTVTLTKQ